MTSTKVSDFEAIVLRLASPERILEWSNGEVLKPETINYRTQKPERDGLFCERIFGPVKDWECYCGKYKRVRYKGVVCDKCGVEVTRSIVRRHRMGHIELAVPVSHIWFLRGVPSRVGLILDLSVQDLERIVYFASYIVTHVDEDARALALAQIETELKQKKKELKTTLQTTVKTVNAEKNAAMAGGKFGKQQEKEFDARSLSAQKEYDRDMELLLEAHAQAKEELSSIRSLQVISELEYHNFSMKYGQVFEAGIGAEAIRKLLERTDIENLGKSLEEEIAKKPNTAKSRKSAKRLKLIQGMLKANLRPEWMLPTIIPVMPPDLRPMVQLDGGRFATSDLNDLYRRVINRNNRLKKLIEIGAPEVIQRNEKRMLQEAVDALIDNSARRGQAVTASTGQKRLLRSLADNLKGKQGRFRQNLLGKRVDYSARSVIVVGPELHLHECGLPKKMALELFKPFVINKLIEREFAHNVRSAGRLIEQEGDIVYDILEEVIEGKYVLLNRAPTLHRLGIQAFRPLLIEGKAIRIHPMVCSAFNADFDGDQMAVHLPLTEIAQAEAREIMVSSKNLLKSSTGDPITVPSQDMVLGCYYLTHMKEGVRGEGKVFVSFDDAILANQSKAVDLRAQIHVRTGRGERMETSVGRILFNEILPKSMGFVNKEMDKKGLKAVIADALAQTGLKETAMLVDRIRDLSFEYATVSGLSWGMSDLNTPKKKEDLIRESDASVQEIEEQYEMGLLTEEERYNRVIEVWTVFKQAVSKLVREEIDKDGPVFAMVNSGARGSWEQTTQMMGTKGTVVNPAGRIIELPIKSSFEQGFNVLEYFISTHGTRKGMADTALRTATAGYLTRRLVDVAQDIIVREEDCHDDVGVVLYREDSDDIGESFMGRVKGRVTIDDIVHPETGEIIVEAGKLISKRAAREIDGQKSIAEVHVRSIVTCRTVRGVCRQCYGYDLGSNEMVKLGAAVGVVAAQAIGEPGTQLTMRTFHSGGVTSKDITHGLPRVEEIFEARPPKGESVIADVDGVIREIRIDEKQQVIVLEPSKKATTSAMINEEAHDDGTAEEEAPVAGSTKKTANGDMIEYSVSSDTALNVAQGDLVVAGQKLTEGNINIRDLFRMTDMPTVHRYIVKEVQEIYATQGESINDKHIEIIIRQMFSRYRITDPGDTTLLLGDVVRDAEFRETNARILKNGGRPASAEQLLLGITKASLSTDSFLAAASFQDTSKILIDAALSGKRDDLRGLKENVIIGKLIPVGTGFDRKGFLK